MDIMPLAQWSNELADVVAATAPAVVFTQGRRGRAASGTAVDERHLVVSDHLLASTDEVVVHHHDDRELKARVVGRDGGTDLALLRVEDGTLNPLRSVAPQARAGQLVVAIGRPFTDLVAHPGFVSGLSGPLRTSSGLRLDTLVHTTLAPFSGFSGGAVIDATGAWLGVSTSAMARGAATVVPAADVRRVVDLLKVHGRIRRGFLGVTTLPVVIPAAQRGGGTDRGLLVTTVLDESPAAGAAVLVGDIIVAAGGAAVTRPQELAAVLGGDRIGVAIPLAVVRGRETLTLEAVVAERR